MANGYRGEKTIELADVKYKMVINMATIAEFQSETGADFMAVAVRALNALYKTVEMSNPLDRAQAMTEAVRLDHAAHLFYICAKAGNSNVEFAEIQEALILEGALETEGKSTYPILFASLVQFALLGVVDDVKKKKSKKPESEDLEHS